MRLERAIACVSRLKCFARYGYAGLIAVGVLYQLVYVWPFWPVTTGLFISGVAVAFFYWFLGGYGLMRVWLTRAPEDIRQSNRPIGVVLLLVATWDMISPIAFRDLHPVSLALHLLGGATAFTLAAIEIVEDPEIRRSRLERARAAGGP